MIHKMLLGAFLAISPMLANAAGLNGAELSIAWAIPFAGILLSIALCPMLVPHFWHNHFGKVAVAWARSLSLWVLCLWWQAAFIFVLLSKERR